MNRLTRMLIPVVPVLLVFQAGCAQKDETPSVDQGRQSKALVPESVNEKDLESATETSSHVEDVRPEGYSKTVSNPLGNPAGAESEHPGKGEVARVVVPSGEDDGVPAVDPSAEISGPYSLQLGSYSVLAIAEEKADQLRKLGHAATIEQAEVGGRLYHRLFIRGLADGPSAEKLGQELQSALGLSYLVKHR